MYAVTNRRWSGGSFEGKAAADNGLVYVHIEPDGTPSRLAPIVFRRRVLEELRGFIDRAEGSGGREHPILVLPIHGFNVDWKEALAFFSTIDGAITQKLDGALTVGFSWPSSGRVTNYVGDRLAARATAIALTSGLMSALRLLQDAKCPAHIVAVCHSMGNYVLSKAASYAVEAAGLNGYHVFSEVLMVAPDLDGGAFGPGGISLDLAALSRRVTVYRSVHDGALMTSRTKRANLTGRRLGRQGADPGPLPDNVTIVDGSAWTDIEPVAAHSEYFRSTPVLADMRAVAAGKDRSAIPGRERRGSEFVLTKPEGGEADADADA